MRAFSAVAAVSALLTTVNAGPVDFAGFQADAASFNAWISAAELSVYDLTVNETIGRSRQKGPGAPPLPITASGAAAAAAADDSKGGYPPVAMPALIAADALPFSGPNPADAYPPGPPPMEPMSMPWAKKAIAKDPSALPHATQAEWDLFVRSAILSRAAFLKCPTPGGDTVKVADYKDGTHGYISLDKARKEIDVVMRGTMSPHDGVTDVKFLPTPYTLPGSEGCQGCMVHRAIQAVTAKVIGPIMAQVAQLKQQNPDYRILVTGHSLGGATCSFISLALRRVYNEEVTGVCLGSPRVGNPAFSAHFDKFWTPMSYFRVTHYHDGVPQLPPAILGFQHAGREYWISKRAATGPQDVVVCNGDEDPNCNDQFPSEVVNAINRSHLHYIVNFLTPKCGPDIPK